MLAEQGDAEDCHERNKTTPLTLKGDDLAKHQGQRARKGTPLPGKKLPL